MQAPLVSVIQCTGQARLPFLDPDEAGPCHSFPWVDGLDYYYNERDANGNRNLSNLLAFTTSHTLTFKDTPADWRLGVITIVRFTTSLVGVRHGNTYSTLTSFSWLTRYNGLAGGIQILANTSDPDEGTGSGGVTIEESGIPTAQLPLPLRQFLAQNGADNIPLPDPIDVDGDGALDDFDNCQGISNPDQLDTDEDLVGDACDNCEAIGNPRQFDGDDDLLGEACDNCLLITTLSKKIAILMVLVTHAKDAQAMTTMKMRMETSCLMAAIFVSAMMVPVMVTVMAFAPISTATTLIPQSLFPTNAASAVATTLLAVFFLTASNRATRLPGR